MNTFFLSLGSNIDPAKNIPLCLDLLKKQYRALKVSSIYETEPVGIAGKDKFWNAAVAVETSDDVDVLRSQLRRIEEKLGRKRDPSNKFASRTIDVDILPQPGYQQQAFIMIPLAEIAPEAKDPETQKSFRTLADSLKDAAGSFRKVGG